MKLKQWFSERRWRRAVRSLRALTRNQAVRLALDVLDREERESWTTRMRMLTDAEKMDQRLFADLQVRYVKMVAEYNQAVGAAELLRRELWVLKEKKEK